MLIKRFKRPQLGKAIPLASAVPLLKLEGISAQFVAEDSLVASGISPELKESLFYIEQVNAIAYNRSNSPRTATFTPRPIELNSQLLLANYFLRSVNNIKKNKPKKARSSQKTGHLAEKMTSSAAFYTQSVSSQATCENEALVSNSTLLVK